MNHKPNNPPDEQLPRLPVRDADSHKGDYGRALLLGGSRGMSGAIALAGRATLRSGAGLVTLAVPEAIQAVVAAMDPCFMTIGLDGNDDEQLGSASILEIPDATIDAADVWAIGPGLGQSVDTARMVARLYREIEAPMVVDADGLNGLAHHPDALAEPAGTRVLTPHPGEFMRLALAVDPDWDAALAARSGDTAKRQKAAEWLAARDRSGQTTVVLKGHGTIVTDGKRTAVNQTGNPGMATGGSGDVLTGVITGLLCQGLSPWDAARLAVHLHGLAGDLAAETIGQISLVATDLIEFLPKAISGQWAVGGGQ
jgi:NAD(P)H-hydrate epimerase